MRLYRTPEVVELVGCSYRQLDYWCRSGQVECAVPAQGSGSTRRLAVREVQVAWVLTQLSRLGAPRLPSDLDVLRRLPRFVGWFVWSFDGTEYLSDVALLDSSLMSAAMVVALDTCPVDDDGGEHTTPGVHSSLWVWS